MKNFILILYLLLKIFKSDEIYNQTEYLQDYNIRLQQYFKIGIHRWYDNVQMIFRNDNNSNVPCYVNYPRINMQVYAKNMFSKNTDIRNVSDVLITQKSIYLLNNKMQIEKLTNNSGQFTLSTPFIYDDQDISGHKFFVYNEKLHTLVCLSRKFFTVIQQFEQESQIIVLPKLYYQIRDSLNCAIYFENMIIAAVGNRGIDVYNFLIDGNISFQQNFDKTTFNQDTIDIQDIQIFNNFMIVIDRINGIFAFNINSEPGNIEIYLKCHYPIFGGKNAKISNSSILVVGTPQTQQNTFILELFIDYEEITLKLNRLIFSQLFLDKITMFQYFAIISGDDGLYQTYYTNVQSSQIKDNNLILQDVFLPPGILYNKKKNLVLQNGAIQPFHLQYQQAEIACLPLNEKDIGNYYMNYTFLTENCAEKLAKIYPKINSYKSCLINMLFKLEIYQGFTTEEKISMGSNSFIIIVIISIIVSSFIGCFIHNLKLYLQNAQQELKLLKQQNYDKTRYTQLENIEKYLQEEEDEEEKV